MSLLNNIQTRSNFIHAFTASKYMYPVEHPRHFTTLVVKDLGVNQIEIIHAILSKGIPNS
jgi:hypothetical protein